MSSRDVQSAEVFNLQRILAMFIWTIGDVIALAGLAFAALFFGTLFSIIWI